MKLENCGRCGLEPVSCKDSEQSGLKLACPACDGRAEIGDPANMWVADQFCYKTERINAAAVAIYVRMGYDRPAFAVDDAAAMIEAQDERARVRWAEMQGE